MFQDPFPRKMQTDQVGKVSKGKEEAALGPSPGGSWSLYHSVSTVPVLPLLTFVHPQPPWEPFKQSSSNTWVLSTLGTFRCHHTTYMPPWSAPFPSHAPAAREGVKDVHSALTLSLSASPTPPYNLLKCLSPGSKARVFTLGSIWIGTWYLFYTQLRPYAPKQTRLRHPHRRQWFCTFQRLHVPVGFEEAQSGDSRPVRADENR